MRDEIVGRPDPAVEPWLDRIVATEALFVTDERQRIVAWSSAAQRLLGYSPEEIVGRSCYLVLMGRETDGHPVCRRDCPVTANARHGRGTAPYEVAARSRDGLVKCLRNTILVVTGPDGTFRVIHLLQEMQSRPAPALARRPGTASERAAEARVAEERAPITERLTRRELEVLRLFAAGSTIDEIAGALTISVFTARNHIANIQRKLGARNRLEVVVLGMRRGLV